MAADPRLDALASAIREARSRFRLSQDDLADGAGLSRNAIGAIERSESVPSFLAVASIAKALGIPLSDLVRVYEERLDAQR